MLTLSRLMHCHIPFHVSGGLGLQFLERPRDIAGALGDLSGLEEGCAQWTRYAGDDFIQGDSGLKRR